MKYYKKSLLIAFSFLSLLSFGFAGNISQTNKNRIDSLMTVVEKQRSNETIFSQISKYEKIINSFSKVKFQNNDQKEMVAYLLERFQDKVHYLQSQVETQDDIISNVDRDLVEETWLSRHNEERQKLWLSPYKINPSLNYSSLVWAQKLANESRTSNTHSRDSSYWYNYSKILDRFNGFGIPFNYNSTAFTENIAYQAYTCKKSDCTQEMIAALKKGFDFFMKEKSYNGSHYRAITHEYFDQLWFWVATNWKYYRVVTHYAINVK